jgi:HEPN domain-containing protein
LYSKIAEEISYEVDLTFLQELDTIYTSSRYPCDIGLMPDGKPTKKLAEQLYEFAKYIYEKTLKMLNN